MNILLLLIYLITHKEILAGNETEILNDELTIFFEKYFNEQPSLFTGKSNIEQILKIKEFKNGWKKFREINNKKYTTKSVEHDRMAAFVKNLKKISEHNKNFYKNKVSYRMGVTEYTDFTMDEYAKMSNDEVGSIQRYINNLPLYSFRPPWMDVPKNFDWRVRGAVSPPRDKGSCASCWAFAAASALEGQLFQKISKMKRLSPQNLVDCSLAYGTHGCKGGSPLYSFAYVNDYGIVTEDSYPYTGIQNTCNYKITHTAAYVSGVVMLEKGNEEHLKLAVGKVGPVITFLDNRVLQLYKSGLINDPSCSKKANHAVLVVGYGTDKDGDYWIVKNCVTNNGGFLKIARNQNNMCGIASNSYYPVIN